MTIATPQPAATVVVLRAGADATPEVLLVRRSDKVAFMAGAYVFPGGRVDDADRAHADRLFERDTTQSRFSDLMFAEELLYRVAAVRELEEEAGVRLTVDDLIPFAHWVTPEVETRRYDTRFFLAEMPERQQARHDAGETTELVWSSPHAAIERCRGGAIMLPPPTWTTLRQLGRFTSLARALAWARSTPIVRVQPSLVRDAEHTMLTLPGDPLYPSIPGWEIPEDTRFVLEEGKGWQPVKRSAG